MYLYKGKESSRFELILDNWDNQDIKSWKSVWKIHTSGFYSQAQEFNEWKCSMVGCELRPGRQKNNSIRILHALKELSV